MHLQKLRSKGALHLPSTRQRNDGHHENQTETSLSSIFRTSVRPIQHSTNVLRKLGKSAALAATLAVLSAPQILSAPSAHAAPVERPVGTWGHTLANATYIRIRPGTQTPVVAKLNKGVKLMVWGTFDGWYRVETTDGKFGWILNSLLSVPQADKLKELSHAKAKKASDRTSKQKLYGKPEQLKKYYATYKAPGAKTGLTRKRISLTAKKPVIAPKARIVATRKPVAKKTVRAIPVSRTPRAVVATTFPREVTITTAEPKTIEAQTVEVKLVESRPVVKAVETPKPVEATVVRKTVTTTSRTVWSTPERSAPERVQATTVAPMPVDNKKQITASDIMNARRNHIQNAPASRHKTSPYEMKSSPDSVIKTAPPAKPVKPKVQPTSGRRSAPAKPIYAKVAISRGGSPRDYARYVAKKEGNTMGDGMASQALTYRGMPYISGAASPSRGFDCSGLVYYLLRTRGYNPPRTAAGFASYGKSVSKANLKPGDLVLFANTYKRGVSHIGVYTGNNNFVHAANSRSGVKTDSLSSGYYANKYYGARRVG